MARILRNRFSAPVRSVSSVDPAAGFNGIGRRVPAAVAFLPSINLFNVFSTLEWVGDVKTWQTQLATHEEVVPAFEC